MKLDRSKSGVLAAFAVALACGCSTPAPKTSSRCPCAPDAALSATGTTNLMSAEVAGPAPRVGKPQLGVEDESRPAAEEPLSAPKDTRRSDGSRRGGDFGTTK